MKIRLRLGANELEVEGTEKEVTAILDSFYVKISEVSEPDIASYSTDDETSSNSDVKKPRKKRAATTQSNGVRKAASGAKVRDDLITQLSNKIKDGGIAADIQLLFDKGSTLQKILGLWRLIPTEQELNAAEMAKMYEKFSIKVKLENIRPVMSKNKDLFIEKTEDGVTYYRPTVQAMQRLKAEIAKLSS